MSTELDDQNYENAQEAIKRAISQANTGTPEERASMQEALKELEHAAEKLRNGHVEIVVFGEINVGKSSLINAILGEAINDVSIIGGKTKVEKPTEWKGSGYRMAGLANSSVVIVDTPGINAVAGAERERSARAATKRSDLILFVTDSDLNEIEFQALSELAETHKPILLVLNQVDKYKAEDRKRLIHVLREEKARGIVQPENVVEAAADPLERERETVMADGTSQIEMVKPAPNIREVKERILQILAEEGKALVALNAAMFAADQHDWMVSLRVKMRSDGADRTIWGWATTKALAVALTPIPVVDVVAGSLSDIFMIVHLANVYGIEMNRKTARDLLSSILTAAGLMIATEWGVHIGSAFLKGVTFGLSTLVTAVPQGAAAGYCSYIVGKSTKYYLEHNASWGAGDAKSVVQDILKHTDKKSVISKLSDAITQKIKKNRHAKADAKA
jgi:small GTP-binding protein